MSLRLLDTSALIAIERGTEELNDWIPGDSRVVIPTVVMAEFLQTAYNSAAPKNLLERRQGLLNILRRHAVIADFDEQSAEIYARLWAKVSDQGQPRAHIDLQIAAISIRHRAEVITFDARADFASLTKLLK